MSTLLCRNCHVLLEMSDLQIKWGVGHSIFKGTPRNLLSDWSLHEGYFKVLSFSVRLWKIRFQQQIHSLSDFMLHSKSESHLIYRKTDSCSKSIIEFDFSPRCPQMTILWIPYISKFCMNMWYNWMLTGWVIWW